MNTMSTNLSESIRRKADDRGRKAYHNYVNGSRKAAIALLTGSTGQISAMATAVFLSLASFSPSAVAFVDTFADHKC